MPRVTIATGFVNEDGREEILSDYQCDVPNCPHPAVHVMGFVREFGGGFAVCAEHAAVRRVEARRRPSSTCSAASARRRRFSI